MRKTSPEGLNSAESNHGFEGEKGQFESPNAIGVIIKYFSIMAVFIIIIYYIEKVILRNKA